VILADVQASAPPAAAVAAESAQVPAPVPPAPETEVAPAPVTTPVASAKPPGKRKPAPRDLAAAAMPEPALGPVVERPGSFHRSVATTLPAADVAAYAAATQRLTLGSTAEMSAFVATHPTRVDARVQLALNLIERGHGAEAEALLQEGLKLLPNQTRLAEVLGHALVDRGDPAAALTVLRPAAPPIAANPDYHALLAAAEQSTGANALAATRYRGLLQLQPTNGRWWIGLGISVRALGDPKTATLAFQRALDDRSLPEPLRDYASREAVRLKEH
jgi:MSHA biogenesis protein MshN